VSVGDQFEFLVSLGARLENWCSPGDAEDYLVRGAPLWDAFTLANLRPPARVIDILLARWVRIKDFQTQVSVALVQNPAQRDFSRERTRDNIVLKAGRAGFTINEMSRALIKVCTRQGYTAVLVAHDLVPAQNYFIQVHHAFRNLAGKLGVELRKGVLKEGKANVREIYLPELNSHYVIDTAGQFAPAQGASLQYVIADEMARWKRGDPKQVIGTLLTHMTSEDAEITMMSRPFGQAGEFYERYWQARRGESTTKAHFYQWWWNPSQIAHLAEDFKPNDEELAVALKYARWRATAPADCGLPAQLGAEKLQWRRNQQSRVADLFGQEFAEDEKECFLGSGNCPFNALSVERVLNDATPVLERAGGKGESENGFIRWLEYDPEAWYVLFIDPAGTLGVSRIAMTLINGLTGEQAAEWVGRCDAATAAQIAYDHFLKRFERTIVAPETNMGQISVTIVARLIELGLTSDTNSWPRFYREHDSGGQWRLGWYTDPKNRPEMLSNFGNIWAASPHLFHSPRLAHEVKTMVRKGDRIEHDKGMTDDLVMSAAGAHKVKEKAHIAPREPQVKYLSTRVRQRERDWVPVG
jgi:hypothetical protein